MAEIIPNNDFSVSGSTWTVKDVSTGEIVFQGKGGGVGLVVDNDGYMATFLSMFPLLVTRKGPGKLRVEAVIAGAAVGMVGHLGGLWVAPDPETAARARTEVASGLYEPSFVTRTTKTHQEPMKIRTQFGDSITGAQSDVERARVISGLPAKGPVQQETPAPEDTRKAEPFEMPLHPDYISAMNVLARAFKGKIVVREASWIERLRALGPTWPMPVICPAGPLPTPLAPFFALKFYGRAHAGGRIVYTTVDAEMLHHLCGPSIGAAAYLGWLHAYQSLESSLHGEAIHTGVSPSEDSPVVMENVIWNLTQMVVNAAQIYLTESRQIPHDQPVDDGAGFRSETITKCCEFIASKDLDYGQSIRRHGLNGIVVRLFDKFARLTTLAARADRLGKFESIEDTARDLLCYSLMALAFAGEMQDNEPSNLIS